jgi:hypothetical protein
MANETRTEHRQTPGETETAGSELAEAWDSNPQVLADNGFQVR